MKCLKVMYLMVAVNITLMVVTGDYKAFATTEAQGYINYPPLYVTLNGDYAQNLMPGFGIIDSDGIVHELKRMTIFDTNNSYSSFGITRNSFGDYWTSTGNALIQFDPNTGNVIRSYPRTDMTGEAFLNVVFDLSDRLIGWSNSNGYLYDIVLGSTSYTETLLVYVGLNAGGLTEMAFSGDGTLFGLDTKNKRLITINIDNGSLSTVVNLPFGSYVGLAFAPDNTLFISDSLTNTLIHLDKSGNELNRQAYVSTSKIMGLEFAPVSYFLSSNVSGTGSGIVTSNPNGIACNSDCYAQFHIGNSVTLHAAPSEFSIFSGWSGDCTGQGDCTIVMNSNKTVTATFDKDMEHMVLLGDTASYYSTLQAAYNVAPADSTLKVWGTLFVENLLCDQSKTATIKGGYDSSYTNNSGFTTLQGTLTIRNGILTVENLQIQ